MTSGDEEERSYELPDGTIIQIDNKTKYRSSEILFKFLFFLKIVFAKTFMIFKKIKNIAQN